MVAQGYGHAIAGIEFFGHVGWFDGQRAGHHGRNLLFARGPGAGDGLLDFAGGVFGNWNVARQGRCQRDPLARPNLSMDCTFWPKNGASTAK